VNSPEAAGAASLRASLDPYVLTGWSWPTGHVFAHEIGHNLGGHHEPVTFKVLDGCAVNGHHWVFAASATDLGFQIRVTDTETDESWIHTKQPGKPAQAVTDSEAFPDACRR